MLSETARARALQRGPGFWGFFLAHHWPGQLQRCYLLWLGDKPTWWCARCLGLYPVLFLVLGLLLALRPPTGWWDWPWLFVLPWPAFIDWARSRIWCKPGSNAIRTLTGALLGVSLARTVYLNMIDPAHRLVLIQLGACLAGVLCVELAARWVGTGPEASE